MAGLVTHVSMRDDVGNVVSFGPGDDVPEWARKRITNPKVWEGGEVAEFPEGNVPANGTAAGGGAVEPPPTSGAGAGRDDWAAYAATQGVEVQEEWKRADIIDALKKAGKRVE
jgi:hypothetical protein